MTLSTRMIALTGACALLGALLEAALSVVAGPTTGWALSVALAIVLGSVLAARWILRPLRLLTRCIGDIPGDADTLSSLAPREDEVGVLSRAMREMQQRLEHRNAALTQAYLTVMESERRLAGIIEHLVEGFVIVEGDGTIQRANSAAHRMFGYAPETLTGKHVCVFGWQGLDRHDAGAWFDRVVAESLMASDHDDHTLLDGRTSRGETVPMQVGVTRVEQDGRVLYCLLVRDLTLRLRMERELRDGREFLHRLVDLLPVAVYLKEASSLEFRMVNRAMEELIGTPREACLGRPHEALPGLERSLARRFTRRERQLANGECPARTDQYQLPTIDGQRTVRGTTVPLTDGTGRITHLLGVLEDLSDQIAVQNELQTQKQRAEAASQAKSEFLANVSHELRTPLNAIIGYSEMLDEIAREESRDQDSRDLQRIMAAGRHLLSIINDILDLAKSESGKIVASYAPLNVQELLQEVLAVVEPLMRNNHNRFEVNGSHAGTCVSDESLVKAIVINLLGNAAKFTRDGRVELRYRIDEHGVDVQVTDSGIGIAAEAQSRIFEPFVQADASTSREYGGTGLGLTLVRRFCDELGGQIGVESAPGQGSVFSVSLPNAADAAAPRRLANL